MHTRPPSTKRTPPRCPYATLCRSQMRGNRDPARVPKIHAETVAKQNAGLLALVDQFITPNADQLEGDDRKQLDDAVATLRKAVAGQQEWLDNTLVPNA